MCRITCFIYIATLALLNFSCSREKDCHICDFDGGWLKENEPCIIRCDIFQFKDVSKSSYKEKINKIQMTEFFDTLKFVKEKKHPNTFTPEVRARSKFYVNNSKLFSAWNEIYYHYYHLFPKAAVSENTINLRISPNGDVIPIKISDLFYSGKDWQTELLLKGIELLKKQKFITWNNSTIEDEIKSKVNEFEYYFYSFVITERDSIVLIFQSLSIAPNVEGYPSIEIPLKELPHYNGFLSDKN